MLPGKTYTPADIILMVRRRIWLILLPMAFGLYAALIASSQRHDQFQSEMLIQVVPQRVPDSVVHSTVTIHAEDRVGSLTEQMLSRTVLEKMIQEMDLYPEEVRRLPMQDVVELMRRNAKVDTVPNPRGLGTDSFYIRFTYPNRETSQRVTEQLGNVFIEVNKRDRGDIAQQTSDFLEKELNDTKRSLEETDAKLKQFRLQNAGKLPNQSEFNVQGIQAMNATIQRLADSINRDTDTKKSLERQVGNQEASNRLMATASDGKLSGDPTGASSLQQQLQVAQGDLESKRLRLKADHPNLKTAEKKVQDLTKQIEAERLEQSRSPLPAPVLETPDQRARREQLDDRAEIARLAGQIARNEAAEQTARAQLVEYQRNLAAVPGVENEMTALTRDYNTQTTAYNELLTKSQNSKQAVQLERQQIGEQFKVLDAARLPIRPTGLSRIAMNAAGAVVGLVLGLALSALLEFRDTTFSTGQDVLEVMRLPVAALVPYVVSELDRRRARRRLVLMSAAAAALSIAGGYGVWALELWKHVV